MITFSGPADANGRFTSYYDPTSTVPDQFNFADVTNAVAGETYEASVTISGINAGAAPISVSGGAYKIGSGAYTSGPGIISNGQVVTVLLMAVEGSADLTIRWCIRYFHC